MREQRVTLDNTFHLVCVSLYWSSFAWNSNISVWSRNLSPMTSQWSKCLAVLTVRRTLLKSIFYSVLQITTKYYSVLGNVLQNTTTYYPVLRNVQSNPRSDPATAKHNETTLTRSNKKNMKRPGPMRRATPRTAKLQWSVTKVSWNLPASAKKRSD